MAGTGSKKQVGSGGHKRGLRGRGPTPKAEDRVYHKAYKGAKAPAGNSSRRPGNQAARPKAGGGGTAIDMVVGRNPVFEALQAGIPIKSAYVYEAAERDDRLRDILKWCAQHSVPLLQVTRLELDRMTGGAVHQGVALRLPAFEYADPQDLLADALQDGEHQALVVALDSITDPHNLGAIIRSAAAFGAHGVIIPERRSASMTAAAWKSSAGAAARLPVAMCKNLNRTLEDYAKAGYTIIGLAGEGDVDISGVPGVNGPVLVVVGSEGEGLSRLVRTHCDVLARIPISSAVESLNASVATSVALYEIGRCRGSLSS